MFCGFILYLNGRPLCLAFVDYEKAFDSVKLAVLNAAIATEMPNQLSVPPSVVRNLTHHDIVSIQDPATSPIQLQRGVRQGDVISPQLFTASFLLYRLQT